MILLQHVGVSAANRPAGQADAQPKLTVDLTAEMAMGYDDLIDRILDFTFDVLGIGNVELRVRESAHGHRVGLYQDLLVRQGDAV